VHSMAAVRQPGDDVVVEALDGSIPVARHTSVRPTTSDMPKAQLVWRDLTLTLRKGKVLLDHVSGVAQSGRIMSLMGPSGAGEKGGREDLQQKKFFTPSSNTTTSSSFSKAKPRC